MKKDIDIRIHVCVCVCVCVHASIGFEPSDTDRLELSTD